MPSACSLERSASSRSFLSIANPSRRRRRANAVAALSFARGNWSDEFPARAADRRRRLVRLTPRGQKVDDEMQVIIERLEKRWAAQIGPRRFAQFRRTLVDLNAMIATGRSGSRARSR